MTINIRNPVAHKLAKKLALIHNTTITKAVIDALQARIDYHLERQANSDPDELHLVQEEMTVDPKL